jgi:hypothetical protein
MKLYSPECMEKLRNNRGWSPECMEKLRNNRGCIPLDG